MHLPMPEAVPDSAAQRAADRRRLQRALTASLAFVLLLTVCFAAQQGFDWRALAIAPRDWRGLAGVLTAPLLHATPEHLGGNAVSLLLLGTLAGTVYPRATLRALPLAWLGSGLAAWALGEPGSLHLGARLGHDQAAAQAPGHFLELGRHGAAGSAPGRPEVHEHREARLGDEAIEVRRARDLDGPVGRGQVLVTVAAACRLPELRECLAVHRPARRARREHALLVRLQTAHPRSSHSSSLRARSAAET